jgi:predicted house-cleaning noncanonical NTP pyrophosphatase (MazG superfamily)
MENEENEYPVPDPKKPMVNITKEQKSKWHPQKTLKEEILEKITEKYMETVLDIVKQNV